ncbi:MAG TPA: hypothetical protein ENJ82_05685, partial [Bacteroidetes bacterium]|nr:hypothetical protein [Bacteroidota bacterium]
MSNDPQEFVKNFENKFELHQKESRMQFLIHFRPREFHFYMMILAELRGRYRPQVPFQAMIRKFPMNHWQEGILELLSRFNKKREADPAQSRIENGISFIKAVCAEFPEFFADNLDDLFVARINFPGHLTTYMWQQFGQGYKDFLKLFVEAN